MLKVRTEIRSVRRDIRELEGKCGRLQWNRVGLEGK